MRSTPRSLLCTLTAALGAAVIVSATDTAVSYRHVATLPSVIDGQAISAVKFDPVGQRWWVTAAQSGLYWAEPGQGELRWKGPLVRGRVSGVEIAHDLGRLFFFTPDDLRYVDLTGDDPRPVTLVLTREGSSLAYDPESKRLYVGLVRTPRVMVFDAESGERAPDIVVPGWSSRSLEASPGRIFLQVGGKDGLYAIDTRAHTVAPWPVEGRLVTPAYLDADPGGRYVFASYDRYVAAIDVATARVLDRIVAPARAAIAWDPGSARLLVNWAFAAEQPRIRVMAYRVEGDRLIHDAELSNPVLGGVGLEPGENGFMQRGHQSLLLWSLAQPPSSGLR
jgi:hypothetical protein